MSGTGPPPPPRRGITACGLAMRRARPPSGPSLPAILAVRCADRSSSCSTPSTAWVAGAGAGAGSGSRRSQMMRTRTLRPESPSNFSRGGHARRRPFALRNRADGGLRLAQKAERITTKGKTHYKHEVVSSIPDSRWDFTLGTVEVCRCCAPQSAAAMAVAWEKLTTEGVQFTYDAMPALGGGFSLGGPPQSPVTEARVPRSAGDAALDTLARSDAAPLVTT